MKSVTLIFPDTKQEHRVLLPLALLYAGTPVARAGYRVNIIDQRVEPRWEERLEHLLATEKHVCVGISTMTGKQVAGAVGAGDAMRRLAPHVPLVWGGVHPSLLPDQTLEDPRVDLVVVGEGDETLPELVRVLDAGGDLSAVRGIAYKDGSGKVVRTAPRPFVDLDAQPSVDYGLVDIRAYNRDFFDQEREAIALITSRGCPYPCTYCYEKAFNDRRYRVLSPPRVVAEMRRLNETYGLQHFFFLDDEFFIQEDRVRAIRDELLPQPFARSMTVHNANIRVDEINRYDPALLASLRDLGFQDVFVGVESGSDEILARIKKSITRDDVIRANRKIRQIGIRPIYAFMGGFPFEKAENVWDTLTLMEQLTRENPDATVLGMSLFCPFPGTELYDECVSRGMKPPDRLPRWADIDYTRLKYAMFDPELVQVFRYGVLFSYFIDYKQWPKRAWPLMALKHVARLLIRWRAKRRNFDHLWEVTLLKLRDKLPLTFRRFGAFIQIGGEDATEPSPLVAQARAG